MNTLKALAASVLFLISVSVAHANLLLNGDLENNSAGTSVYNLLNEEFNGFVSDATAFGTAHEIDLYLNTVLAQSGDWMLGIHTSTNGNYDAFSLNLSSSINAGTAYHLQFFGAGFDFPGFEDYPRFANIQIGLSNNATDFGDLIFQAQVNSILTKEGWLQYDYFFTATSGATFLSVRTDPTMNGDPSGTYAFVDNFSINPVPEPSTMLLLGSGLIGLVGYGRRRFKK